LAFNSFHFVAFFAIVFALNWLLRTRVGPRNIVLLLASYYFYGCWDPRFLVLIFLSTGVDYVAALGVAGVRPSWTRRLLLSAWFVASAVLLVAIDWEQVILGRFEWSWQSLLLPDDRGPRGDGTREAMIACYAVAVLWPILAEAFFLLPAVARRRAFFLASLVGNLALLGFFKYYGFFVESAADLLRAIGFEPNLMVLKVVLPAGISFYTFQTLSYTIDVYRGQIPIERGFVNFALFVAFFPQLVAGPIERASHLLPQMSRPHPITAWHLHTGMFLIGWGLFKKVVLADNVAIVANQVFGAFDAAKPPADAGAAAYLGVLAFAIQIYCDFSAYSDIARGAARMLGFDLMRNFNLPYFASNPSEFWRRWHISLSTWLRDYLYIPLGGNRKPPRWTWMHLLLPLMLASWLLEWPLWLGIAISCLYLAYLIAHRCVHNNLMMTMLLGGLWHGAEWTFVLWGLYHGLLLMAHRLLAPLAEAPLEAIRRRLGAGPVQVMGISIFFQFTLFGWLLFRAESIEHVGVMTKAIFTDFSINRRVLDGSALTTVVVCAVTLLVVQIAQARAKDDLVLFRLPLPARALVYAALMLAFIFFGVYGDVPFIYFQF